MLFRSIKRGWNKIKSGANKVGHFIGRSAMMQPKGDHIEVWNAKYLSKGEAERANSPVMSGKIVLSSRIDGRYIFEIDGDIDSSVKIGDFMDFQNIDTPHRERGTGYVEKIDGNKLHLRTDKEMLSDKNKFNESFADMGKQKFMSVLEDELGLTNEDEIEEWVEGIDENWDLANDLMMKLLDGQSLDRTEQIQVAYFLADQLENHF